MSARYPLPATPFKVAMNRQAIESWVSRFPDYGAPSDAPALLHADAAMAMWGMKLRPVLAAEGTRGRFARAARTCPPRACTGFAEMAAGAASHAWRNLDAIENIVCLEGPVEIRHGRQLEYGVVLERFDMASVPVGLRHSVRNLSAQPARMVVSLNGPTASTYTAIFDTAAAAAVLPDARTALSLEFDNDAGIEADERTLASRVTRGERLVAYKRDLSNATGIPPEATEMLSAGSVYPLIVPEGHGGRARNAPMFGLSSLYLSIAECVPGEAGPPPHSHSDTQESFMCIEGEWEMTTGFNHDFALTLHPYDLLPVPTKVLRGFRNTGPGRSRLFVIIQGSEDMADMVAFPKRVGQEMQRRFGSEVLDKFADIRLIFDAEDRVEAA